MIADAGFEKGGDVQTGTRLHPRAAHTVRWHVQGAAPQISTLINL